MPRVVGKEEIVGALGVVGRADLSQAIFVDAVAVDVAGEERVAVLRRPVVAEVDHRPRVGVSAAGATMFFAVARRLPRSAGPMQVVDAARQQFIRVGHHVLPEHAAESAPGTTCQR